MAETPRARTLQVAGVPGACVGSECAAVALAIRGTGLSEYESPPSAELQHGGIEKN